MRTDTVSPAKIEVLPFVLRRPARVSDDTIAKSVREGGIQQPLVVVEDDGKLYLADGLTRLRIAKADGLARVPVAVDVPPKGVSVESYIRKLRFILDHHRQDLLPTQKAELIVKLKKMFNLTQRQVAAYLGIDEDSVTNWLAALSYIEPVREALDAERLTMRAARALDGMTEEGQAAVWKAHGETLTSSKGATVHKEVRESYPPTKFPNYYRDPGKTAERLNRKGGQRKAKPRPQLGGDDKRRLLNNYEVKEAELADGQLEQKQMKAEINACIPIVAAIKRSKELWEMVPSEMREELDRFAEIYV